MRGHPKALRRLLHRSVLRRLAIAAALALCATQTLAVEHQHSDGLEPGCALCAVGQHDAAPLPEAVATPAPSPLEAAPATASIPATRTLPRTRPPARASP